MSNSKFKAEDPMDRALELPKPAQEPSLAERFFMCITLGRAVWARRDLTIAGLAFKKGTGGPEKAQQIMQLFEEFIASLGGFDMAASEMFSALATLPPAQDQSIGVTEAKTLKDWRDAFRQFRISGRAVLAAMREHRPILCTIAPDGSKMAAAMAEAFYEKLGQFERELDALELKLRVAAPGLLIEVAPGGAA